MGEEDGSAIRSYRDLQVWRAAVELAVDCYNETKCFPISETYGITSQIRRSSASIAANIAEGYGRESTATYIQFLRISQGSTKELETHIIIAERVGLWTGVTATKLLAKSGHIGKMLRALIRSLQRKS